MVSTSNTARASGWCLATALALVGATLPAQEDLTLPPRIDDTPPERARLAPQPEERREALDEIVVVGGGIWRLPDLGSGLRREREEEERIEGRLAVSFLPLYDPDRTGQQRDLLAIGTELDRVGFIELFRIHFGRRRSLD